jgi:hypothetical protein
MYILQDKTGRRAAHWSEIKSRVRTHEGELLTVRKGREYQTKYGKKHLNWDTDGPVHVPYNRVKEFEKTGR